MKKISVLLLVFLLTGCTNKSVVPPIQPTPTTDISTSASPTMNVYTKDNKTDFAVSQEEAIKIATDYENGIIITEIDLDEDNGRVVYEMNAYIGNTEYDIKIDVTTGDIIEWRQD